MTLIFDIKKYNVGAKTFENYGYSIIPLFDNLDTDELKSTIEFYINSGIYSVRIATCLLLFTVACIQRISWSTGACLTNADDERPRAFVAVGEVRKVETNEPHFLDS